MKKNNDHLFTENPSIEKNKKILSASFEILDQKKKESYIFNVGKMIAAIGLTAIIGFTTFQIIEVKNNNQIAISMAELNEFQLDEETNLDESIEIASDLEFLENLESLEELNDLDLKEAI